MIWYIPVLAALIWGSGFLSSSETAFLSISRVTLRHLQKSQDPENLRVLRLRQNLDSLLTTILVGNNLVNNLASSLAAALAISLAGSSGVGIASAVMTVVIVLFGEILPKTVAAYRPLETAKRNAPLLELLKLLLTPVVIALTAFTTGLLRLAGKTEKSGAPLVTQEELKALFDLGTQEGTLEHQEKAMLQRIFQFSDLRTVDIMRHRSLVKAVPQDASFDQVIQAFTASGYSRLPVYSGEAENYIGIIHYKDVLFYRRGSKANWLKGTMRKLRFIPGTMSVVTVLQVFKAERTGFAVVMDEHGGNSGIITINDVLNAVLGRMVSGVAAQEPQSAEGIRILGPAEFSVPGDLKLSEFNEMFTASLDSEFFDTLGGWLLERFDSLPETGASIRVSPWKFEVEEQEQRRIQRIHFWLKNEEKPNEITKID
jgi:putative hemolysin